MSPHRRMDQWRDRGERVEQYPSRSNHGLLVPRFASDNLVAHAAARTMMRRREESDTWIAPAVIRSFRRPLRRRLDECFEEAMRHHAGSRIALRKVVRDAVSEGVADGVSPATIETALRTYFAEHPARLAFDRRSVITRERVFDQLEADIRRWINEPVLPGRAEKH